MHTDLPTHPTTGLRAIGVLPSGRPVWPVMGGDGTGEGEPGQGENGQGGGGNGQGGEGGENRSFNQADVDRIVAERLAREKAKTADYDDLKAKAAKYDEHQAAQQTDLEKLQGQYEDLLKKSTQAERDLRITRAAHKHGLSEEAIGFLHGDTDEEVDANAKKLAELTASQSGGGTNDGQGEGGPAGGSNGGNRRFDPSQGRGSTGSGTSSVAAGRERARARYGTNT